MRNLSVKNELKKIFEDTVLLADLGFLFSHDKFLVLVGFILGLVS